MKIISTKTHGVLDYLMGIFLIASPWLLHFNGIQDAMLCPVIAGSAMIMLALLTDYEPGLIRAIPMQAHLILDALMGLFLAASPWLLNFSEYVYIPHLVIGIAEILVVFLTKRTPGLTSSATAPRI